MKKLVIVITSFIFCSILIVACKPDPQTTAISGVSSNAEWDPYVQSFNGVEMVLVPAGCFMMGSEMGTGIGDSSPVHEVCFDKPYWIDRTEVTNADFGSEGDFAGVNRPRENINWHEAKSHCEARGARLPTEAEWEFAARGPDNWQYPWGVSFVPENTVYSQNSFDETADVASRPAGVSWMGAYDLAGNVREWTNSIGDPYPYDPLDGRESPPSGGSVIQPNRIVRGGAWDNLMAQISLTNRTPRTPEYLHNFIGFRCALDFDGP